MFDKRLKAKIGSIFVSRPFLSKEKFFAMMTSANYKAYSICSIYDSLFDYLHKLRNFSIYPQDDVINDFEIDDEDLGDILAQILKKCDKPFPTIKQQNEFYKSHGEQITVERLIQFIDIFTT